MNFRLQNKVARGGSRPTGRYLWRLVGAVCSVCLTMSACGRDGTNVPVSPVPATTRNAAPREIIYYGYKVVKTYPHDPGAFTQGLVFHDGKMLESTGLYNVSGLREVDFTTGKVLR